MPLTTYVLGLVREGARCLFRVSKKIRDSAVCCQVEPIKARLQRINQFVVADAADGHAETVHLVLRYLVAGNERERLQVFEP